MSISRLAEELPTAHVGLFAMYIIIIPNLIPKEQKGCYRGSKGSMDQLLISKAILQECKRKKKN